MRLKAVYVGNEWTDTEYYTPLSPPRYSALFVTGENPTYTITQKYRGVSNNGRGTRYCGDPILSVTYIPNDSSKQVVIPYYPIVKDGVYEYTIFASKCIDFIEYCLVHGKKGYNPAATTISDYNGALTDYETGEDIWPFRGIFLTHDVSIDSYYDYDKIGIHEGMIIECTIGYIVDKALRNALNGVSWNVFKDIDIRKDENGSEFNFLGFSSEIQSKVTAFANMAKGIQHDAPIVTYYQLQWAIINNGEYLSPAAAKAACQIYDWCKEDDTV